MSTLSVPYGLASRTSPFTSREDLPAYSSSPREDSISSTSLTQKGIPWLTLNVSSTRTTMSSSKTIPLYRRSGCAISGDVVLLLDKPESIQAVKVSVRGTSSCAGSESSTPRGQAPVLAYAHTFLDLTESLWTASEGVPSLAEPPPWGFPKNGKLQGKYTFPFTLHLPQQFPSESPRPKDGPASYRLPASWFDKKSPAAIDYYINVTLIRGTLKTNTSLSMSIIYAPRTRPDPPSELRRLAYTEGFAALDPLGDAAGWHTVNPPPKVRGKLGNGQTVEVACMFALAKPLTYSRGSFVPLHLAIQCSDPQALHVLQSPTGVPIILLQTILTGKNAHGEKQKGSREVHISPVAHAVCWPSTNTAGQWDDCRMLMGEIALPKKIPPSTLSPRVVIRYSVVMLPFDVMGFTPTDPHAFVVDQPIDIATHNADGPPPRSQLPPGYDDPRKDHSDRFEQVMKAMSKFG